MPDVSVSAIFRGKGEGVAEQLLAQAKLVSATQWPTQLGLYT